MQGSRGGAIESARWEGRFQGLKCVRENLIFGRLDHNLVVISQCVDHNLSP